MIRAVLTVRGEAQEAGYRAFVLRTARKLGLEGYVENRADGTVTIACEGDKKDIECLVRSIKIKTETIDVEGVDTRYEKPTGEFEGKGFTVQIDESFRGLAQEMFQGYATASKYLKVGWDKQDKMLDKQDKTLDKQDKMLEKQDATYQEIKEFKDQTNVNFQTMKTDYGRISQDLTKAIQGIETMAKSIEKLANAIVESKT